MISDCGVKGLWLLMLVSWNLPWGWEREALRLQELRDSMKELFSLFNARNCCLFLELVSEIIEDHEMADIIYPGEADPDLECWHQVHARVCLQKFGRRTTMCRFLGSLTTAKEMLPRWGEDKFIRTYLAVEKDMLKGGKLMTSISVGPADAVTEGGGSTAPHRVGIVEKTARGSGGNAVVISVLMLSEPMNKKIVQIVVSLAGPTLKWHQHQNSTLRDATASSDWIKKQIAGDFMSSVCQTVQLLTNDGIIGEVGFCIKAGLSAKWDKDTIDQTILMEDEMAEFFGQFCMCHVRHRLRRDLWIFSWPTGMAHVLSGPVAAASTIAAFKEDWDIWEHYQHLPNKTAAEELLMQRHVFNLRCNKHYKTALHDLKYSIDRSFNRLIEENTTGMITTQAVEDSVCAAKSIGRGMTGPKFKRPERAMAAIIDQQIIQERHHFTPLPVITAGVPRTARLPLDAFQPKFSLKSMDLQCISSPKQHPEWWSPSAQNYTVPHADLAMLKDAHRQGNLHLCRHAWLGEAMHSKNKLALFMQLPGQEEKSWSMALHHFKGSSILVWPCKVHQSEHRPL